MAVKRASLRGKGASIFFGGDDEEERIESPELTNSTSSQVANFETPQAINSATVEQPPVATLPPEQETSRLSESRSSKLDNSDSSEPASARVAKSQTGSTTARSRSPLNRNSEEVLELQSHRVTDNESFDDYDYGTGEQPIGNASRVLATPLPSSRLPYSETSQARNFATSEVHDGSGSSARGSNLQSPRVGDSRTSGVSVAEPSIRQPHDYRPNLQSPTVGDSRSGRVANNYTGKDRYNTSIADETRAEYIVDYDENNYPATTQASFSEFYLSGETHYLMLEPLATRLTTEQMDRLSALERRIHQGRRRKEPRVTKNSIIRALLEATFDLELDTRDVNSELELVNRFREALHLASLVGEVQE